MPVTISSTGDTDMNETDKKPLPSESLHSSGEKETTHKQAKQVSVGYITR